MGKNSSKNEKIFKKIKINRKKSLFPKISVFRNKLIFYSKPKGNSRDDQTQKLFNFIKKHPTQNNNFTFELIKETKGETKIILNKYISS